MSYSFEGRVRLESTILRGPNGLFEAALEMELYCIEKAAKEARKQALEDKHGQIQNHSTAE